jgi:hypothetical protein
MSVGLQLAKNFSPVEWSDADPISHKLIRSVAVHDSYTLLARLASEDSTTFRVENAVSSSTAGIIDSSVMSV